MTKRVLIIDTETANMRGGVIELAAVEVFFEGRGQITTGDVFHMRYGLPPGECISVGAMAVHHIIPSDIEGLLPYNELPKFCEADVYIGHNVKFDLRMLGIVDAESVCTLGMSRNAYPGIEHNLSAMYYYLFGATETTRHTLRNAHSADADVKMCFDILAEMLKDSNVDSPEALLTYYSEMRVPTRMPGNGKHGGKLISQVPNDYRNWYRFKAASPDPLVLEAFEKYPYQYDAS